MYTSCFSVFNQFFCIFCWLIPTTFALRLILGFFLGPFLCHQGTLKDSPHTASRKAKRARVPCCPRSKPPPFPPLHLCRGKRFGKFREDGPTFRSSCGLWMGKDGTFEACLEPGGAGILWGFSLSFRDFNLGTPD